ncbi:hypothetical protein [Rhodohalobacter sp.]|uniref:hypothetical protein n=1 Tax=Rhodohalobacter sp. TaxID=1974210 RepID=UPI002ACD8841|nr:hypothetical protein [Rhodohalobacter sp.]MDZ7756412.1 hypothetical protein [Rhodohalobacter sp.]
MNTSNPYPLFKAYILTLFLFFMAMPLMAQSTVGTNVHVDIWNSETPIVQGSNEEVRGTQWYREEWTPGRVILRDNSITEVHDINYNTYEDKIIFKDGNIMKAYDPTQVRGFQFLDRMGNKTQEFVTGISDRQYGIDPYDLFRVIYNGDTKFLARHEMIFIRNRGRDIVTNKRYSEYDETVTYYLMKDGKLTKTRLRKRNILNDIGDQKDALNDFVKSSKLRLKSEEDVAALLNYYDQIK